MWARAEVVVQQCFGFIRKKSVEEVIGVGEHWLEQFTVSRLTESGEVLSVDWAKATSLSTL
jgi:hypothetical protein